MKISKWFHVLVMGGASLLSSGCGGGDADPGDLPGDDANAISDTTTTDAASKDTATPTDTVAPADPDAVAVTDIPASVDTPVATDSVAPADAAADTTAPADAASVQDASNTSDAAQSDVAMVDADQSEAMGLLCSETPSPGDACGCPCCWAMALNTDPECSGFCAAGNDGAGCCVD